MGTSTATADFTNTANWQGIDDEPTAGSNNLVKSNSIFKNNALLSAQIGGLYDYVFDNGLDIDDPGVWIANTNAMYLLCEVYPGANVIATAKSVGYYCFLKSYSTPSVNAVPDFATGYSTRVYYTTLNIEAPVDAKYLYFQISKVTENLNVTSLTIDGVDRLNSNGISKSLKEKLQVRTTTPQYPGLKELSSVPFNGYFALAGSVCNKMVAGYSGGYLNADNVNRKFEFNSAFRGINNSGVAITIDSGTEIAYPETLSTFGALMYDETDNSVSIESVTANIENKIIICIFVAQNNAINKICACPIETRINGKQSVSYLQPIVEQNKTDVAALMDRNIKLDSIFSDDYPTISVRIDGDGNWESSVRNKSVIIPVNPGDSVLISPQTGNHVYFALLKTYPSSFSGTPDYSDAEGFTGRFDEQQEMSFTVPSDSHYLFVNLIALDVDRKPGVLLVNSYDKIKGEEGLLKGLDGLSFWTGTQIEYDALSTYDDRTVYLIK